jgi:hypothetical protein
VRRKRCWTYSFFLGDSVPNTGGASEMAASFQATILAGIPDELPARPPLDPAVSHAPKRTIEVRSQCGCFSYMACF